MIIDRDTFAETLDGLQGHLMAAAIEYLDRQGAQADWLSYLRQASSDLDQHAREIMFYAGDLWPESETA
jgi:hypothetical protein